MKSYKLKGLIASLLLTLSLIPNTAAEETALYKVTLDVSFTKTNFNNSRFPSNPHFSPVVLTSHNASFDLFKIGTRATPGVKLVAETGSPRILNAELDELLMNKQALEKKQTRGLSDEDSVSQEILVTKDFPLISAITMIAPSPDWIIGVSGLSLLNGDQFIEKLIIPLYAIDAGTDSGKYYTSRNRETKPQGVIHLLKNVSGLSINNSFGTLTIEKL